ncbi:hypothetical protein [Mycobacterium tilburgii]|uniref:hypothetical protein n=1 Tax=Mycobacterium tilburgii TaxID=44467 RepID=UPI001181F233|nr:hypothetical protein [Mycobacterium tilburgii]
MTASQQPEAKLRSTADTIATVILFVLAATLSVSYSILFRNGHRFMCAQQLRHIGAGLGLRSGVGLAGVVAVGGIVFAATRKRGDVGVAGAALVLIVIAVTTGALLADSVVPHR